MEGVTLGALDYAPTGCGHRLRRIPDVDAVPDWPAALALGRRHPSEQRFTRSYRESTRARRAGPRPGPRFGASDRRSTAPAASNCSVMRRVSSATSCSSAVAFSSTAPRFSLARRMSSVSFIVRLTPRAAVVARPMVPAPIDLRPKSAPRIVAPTDNPVCSFCCVAWDDSRSIADLCPPALLLDLRPPGRILLAQVVDSGVTGHPLRIAHARLEITFASHQGWT